MFLAVFHPSPQPIFDLSFPRLIFPFKLPVSLTAISSFCRHDLVSACASDSFLPLSIFGSGFSLPAATVFLCS
jgi:hypothetical protein